MNIGFNVKIIKDTLKMFEQAINYLDIRVLELENNTGSEWVEITSANGQEAEITQEFSEIRLLAKCFNANYSVTYNYDTSIFHNNSSNPATYMICGNPTENNYGCKFKYMKQPITEKQFVCVDSCFNGGSQDTYEFRAWIKPKNSSQ